MNDIQYLATLSIVTKLGTLIVGALCIFLGYRLFMRGIYSESSDVKAAWGSRSLLIKRAAPGSLFALFGVILISVSILFPSQLNYREKDSENGKIPAYIAPLLQKIVHGTALTDSERTEMKLWIEATTSTSRLSLPERIIHFAPAPILVPPAPVPPLPVPVPAR